MITSGKGHILEYDKEKKAGEPWTGHGRAVRKDRRCLAGVTPKAKFRKENCALRAKARRLRGPGQPRELLKGLLSCDSRSAST